MTKPTGPEPRESKPAAELLAGDRIHTTDVMGRGWARQTHEVRHVEPTGPADTDLVVVMVAGGRTFELFGDNPVDLVTDAELADAEAAESRAALTRALRSLAGRIDDLELPVDQFGCGFSIVLDRYADLARWADAFGATITGGGTDSSIPVIRRKEFGRLDVHAQCMEEMPAPAEPEPARLDTWPVVGAPADADVDPYDASRPLLPIAPKVDPALSDFADGTGDPVPAGVDGYTPTTPGRVAQGPAAPSPAAGTGRAATSPDAARPTPTGGAPC